jgi:hypothetical protein
MSFLKGTDNLLGSIFNRFQDSFGSMNSFEARDETKEEKKSGVGA